MNTDNSFLQPVFSVITVTYNAAQTVEKTIKSVLEQTYERLEYIVVDGASKDGTQEIVRKYSPRISTFVSEPDNGLYDAMNKGMALAKGDYLCFLNAGDSFRTPDTLQQMLESLSHPDKLPDILYGETAVVDPEGNFLYKRRLSAPEVLTWKSFKQGMLVSHQAFFAKRSIAEAYDLKYRYSADVDWCIRLMKKSNCIHNTHLMLINYLNEGMTTQHRLASLKERFRIMCRHYGWFSTVLHHLWFVLRLAIK